LRAANVWLPLAEIGRSYNVKPLDDFEARGVTEAGKAGFEINSQWRVRIWH
jgi:hypothetical protein